MGRKPGSKNKVQELKDSEVLASVKDITVDTVSSKLASTQVEVNRKFGDLSAKLTEQLELYQNVVAAIDLKRQELANLHGIAEEAQNLDDLNKVIEDTRLQWAKETEERNKREAELYTEKQRTQKRLEDEYAYELAQRRKKDEDTYRVNAETQHRRNLEHQAGLEKAWAEREAALKAKEARLGELETTVANMPAMIKSQVDKEVAIATNSVKREYETKITLMTKDADTEKKLAEQNILSRNDTIAKLNVQLVDLQKQVDKAHAEVKEIAAKALDSASGRAVTEALKEAMASRDASTKPSK